MFVKQTALHRLLQTIAWRGQAFTFFRPTLNDYGEKSGEPVEIATVNGMFHNGSAQHIAVNTSDSGMTIEKNTPYILMSWGNAQKLQLEDTVVIAGDTYKVTGRTDISKYGLIGDVSLEVVL